MNRCAPWGLNVEMADCFYINGQFCDSFKMFIRLLFEINNKVIDPFSITAKCALTVRETADKITLLAQALLIITSQEYSQEHVWVLGNNFGFVFKW